MMCSKCKGVYYCCKEHQEDGWRKHKKQCVSINNDGDKYSIKRNSAVYFESLKQLSNFQDNSYRLLRHFDSSLPQNYEKNETGGLDNAGTFDWCKFLNIPSNDSNGKPLDQIFDGKKGSPESACLRGNNASGEKEKDVKKNNLTYECLANFCYEILSKTDNDDRVLNDISGNVVKDLDQYGFCVVDNFLGVEKGEEVLQEVCDLHSKGVFQDGQLLHDKKNQDLKKIRSDRIAWVDGKRAGCRHIDHLLTRVDKIVTRANRMENNGELGKCKIDGRTKAMVACYPSGGAHYVKHVDNPDKDGRRITVIYYLNRDWDSKRDGGLLRIFPAGWKDSVADIEPLFDRLLFFWSDRRNPHEVQPSFRTRYAVTLWYFDAEERKQATNLNKGFVAIGKTLDQSSCHENGLFF